MTQDAFWKLCREVKADWEQLLRALDDCPPNERRRR